MVREYKDSGIEWIGRIPKDWKVCKLNYIYRFQTGATPPTNVESYFNGDIKWANISDLGARTIFDTNKKLSNSGVDKCCMSISPKGSLMYSFKLSVGLVSFCGDDMYTNEAIATFLEGYGYLPYLYYMAPIAIIHNANFNIYGAPILNQELIKGAKIIVPPLAEQRAIASYLDRKCAEIDSLVELQEQMIAQLTDYKQSVITEAVTKGLNPEAELVSSGIDWIGDVPKGWKVIKLKFISKFINGFAFKSDYFNTEGEYPVIRIGDIINEKISYENIVFVSKSKELEEYEIITNDILIAMSGATVGKIGICQSNDYGYINQRVGIIRSKDYKLIWYNLLSSAFLEYIFLMSDGSAQPNISSVGIGNYCIPIPPLEEQRAIASYLDAKCHEIDTLISIKRQKIETLKDYKKSIIFEAVTGKTNID